MVSASDANGVGFDSEFPRGSLCQKHVSLSTLTYTKGNNVNSCCGNGKL